MVPKSQGQGDAVALLLGYQQRIDAMQLPGYQLIVFLHASLAYPFYERAGGDRSSIGWNTNPKTLADLWFSALVPGEPTIRSNCHLGRLFDSLLGVYVIEGIKLQSLSEDDESVVLSVAFGKDEAVHQYSEGEIAACREVFENTWEKVHFRTGFNKFEECDYAVARGLQSGGKEFSDGPVYKIQGVVE